MTVQDFVKNYLCLQEKNKKKKQLLSQKKNKLITRLYIKCLLPSVREIGLYFNGNEVFLIIEKSLKQVFIYIEFAVRIIDITIFLYYNLYE